MSSVAPKRAASPAWIYRIVEADRTFDRTVEIVHVGAIDALDDKLEAMLDAAGVLVDGAVACVIGDANAHAIGVAIHFPGDPTIGQAGNTKRAWATCVRLCSRAGGHVVRGIDVT